MAHDNEHQIGTMDISQHKKAYAGFLVFSKWSTVGILLTMVLLAIFRTN